MVSLWDGYQAEDPEPRMRLDAIFPRARIHFGFFNDVFTAFSGDFAPQRGAIIYCCALRKVKVEVLQDGSTVDWSTDTDFRQWALDHRGN